MNFIGEFSALAAAFFWAMASVIYRRLGLTVSPLVLNGFKEVVSLILLGLTMLILNTTIPLDNGCGWAVLFASGVVGIGLGDTAFFAALNSLGERRAVLTIETIAPPITVVLGAVLLRELLSLGAIASILITLAGVFWVLAEKKGVSNEATVCRKGIAWGAVAALCQALGGVMSRGVLSDGTVGPLWSASVRLLGGLVFVVIALVLRREKIQHHTLLQKKVLGPLIVATFFGTFLAIFLQQLSLKHANAAVTQTMIATSAIFVIPFVFFQGERISIRAVVGSMVALGGIVLLFMFR